MLKNASNVRIKLHRYVKFQIVLSIQSPRKNLYKPLKSPHPTVHAPTIDKKTCIIYTPQ